MKLRACLMTTCRNEVSAAPAIAPEWAERIHTVERSPTVRSPDTPGRRPPDARIPVRYPGRIAPAHRTGSRVRPSVRSRSERAHGMRVSPVRVTGPGGMKTAPHIAVGRRLRRLTSYQASPRLVVMGSSTLVDRPDDVPPAAYSGEWVPGSARGAPTGGGRGFSSTPSLARRGSLTQ